MKRFFSGSPDVRFLILTALFGASLVCCTNSPCFPDEEIEGLAAEGDIIVKLAVSGDPGFPSTSRSASVRPTIYPNGDPSFFLVDYYSINAIDSNGRWKYIGRVYPYQLDEGIGNFYEDYWFFEVTAYSDEDVPIAAGTTTAAITASGTNIVSVRLDCLINASANGNLGFALNVERGLSAPSLSVTLRRLKPENPTPIFFYFPSFSFSLYAESVHIPNGYHELSAGMYRMDIVLSENSVVVWGESEIVYIMPDSTSPYARTVQAIELMP